MKKEKKMEAVGFGKTGAYNVRLKSCKALKGIVFSDRKSFSTTLQNTLGKVRLKDGSTVGKGKMLGVVAVGKYTGRAKIIQLKDTDGKIRNDFAVQLLDECKVNWSNVISVGSLSK